MELREVFSVYIYTVPQTAPQSFFLVLISVNSTFKRKKSALKISIVKFSFYFVCGININWFSTNAFFFRLFSTENTQFFLDCMQPFVCFWSVNNSFLIFISIICIIKYSWLKHSCFFDKPSEAVKPPILCPRIQRGYKIS